MQAAEGWEGGEDETDCSFRGFAVVEERNTAVVCGVKWFFFLLLSFFFSLQYRLEHVYRAR